MSKNLRLPAFLMILTILVITGFQAYWLRKNYQKEKMAFAVRTNFLFRETLFRLQATKLKLYENFNIKLRQREGVVSMVNSLRDHVTDTSLYRLNPGQAVVIPMDNVKIHPSTKPDTSLTRLRPEGNPVFEFLTGVDSLQDPITVKEATAAYRKALDQENIHLPFTITASETAKGTPVTYNNESIDDSKVTIGFAKPTTFTLRFGSYTWFIVKKLSQLILVSIVLVGVTILSFLLLYRNIIKQRRLTAIQNDFISNITHELKTPIATVGVAIEALKNFNALDDPKRTREYLDISVNELERLSLLVDQVLRFSMFEKKGIELKKETFDFRHLVSEILITFRPLFEKHNASVTFRDDGGIFMMEGDRLHLTSVIYNLLDNALKYSKESPVINLHLSTTKYDVFEFTISDNGIGIPPEYRFKIFNKFFRVPTGDKHNIKGYGLGLSYVWEVILRHQGYIDVKSELGEGSTFILKIPFVEKDVIRFDAHRKIIKKQFKLG